MSKLLDENMLDSNCPECFKKERISKLVSITEEWMPFKGDSMEDSFVANYNKCFDCGYTGEVHIRGVDSFYISPSLKAEFDLE